MSTLYHEILILYVWYTLDGVSSNVLPGDVMSWCTEIGPCKEQGSLHYLSGFMALYCRLPSHQLMPTFMNARLFIY